MEQANETKQIKKNEIWKSRKCEGELAKIRAKSGKAEELRIGTYTIRTMKEEAKSENIEEGKLEI